MNKLFFIIFFIPLFVNSQNENGVHFIRKITNWSDIVIQAKKENKYIFVDCYTTWCGPCKYVANEVFPKKNVGEFYNNNFICLSLQMDETAKDNEDIVESRTVASSLNELYPIEAYPTFLIFNQNGLLVHKFIGAGNDSMMIAKAKSALNENNQYYTLLDKYKNGDLDSAILKNLVITSVEVGVNPDLFLNLYFQSIKDLYNTVNGNLLLNLAWNTKSLAFENLFAHKEDWKKVIDKNELQSLFVRLIFSEIASNNYFFWKQHKIENDEILNKYILKYSTYGKIAALSYLINYYSIEKKDANNLKIILEEIAPYPIQVLLDSYQLNFKAWSIFKYFNDKEVLTKALALSKITIDKEPENASFLDTYANLLYKLGNIDEAIEIQSKAISLAKLNELKKKLENTLQKMKSNKPTWNKDD